MKTFKVLLITLIAIAGIAYAADKTFRIDKIIENTDATGVDVDGVNIKDTTVKANTGDLTLDSTNQIIIPKEAVFQAGIRVDTLRLRLSLIAHMQSI